MSNATCSIEGCDNPRVARGWCNKHYIRFRLHGDPLYRFKPEGRQICDIADCSNYVSSHGLCAKHHARFKRTGSTEFRRGIVRHCEVDGCERKYYGLGYCQLHYWRKRRGQSLRQPRDIIDDQRQCARCLVVQPLNDFGISARLANGRNIYCSACLSDMGHIRRANKRANKYEAVDRGIVLDRDDWQCHICKEQIPRDAEWPDPLSASMDHVIPLALGGEHTYENLKSSHLTCNIRKGARLSA